MYRFPRVPQNPNLRSPTLQSKRVEKYIYSLYTQIRLLNLGNSLRNVDSNVSVLLFNRTLKDATKHKNRSSKAEVMSDFLVARR